MFKLLILALLLVGCEKTVSERTSNFTMPEALSHCRVYSLNGEDGSYLNVVHCPNASTTVRYREGKFNRSVTIVDGK